MCIILIGINTISRSISYFLSIKRLWQVVHLPKQQRFSKEECWHIHSPQQSLDPSSMIIRCLWAALILIVSTYPSSAGDVSIEALLRENAALKKEIKELRSISGANWRVSRKSHKQSANDIPLSTISDKNDTVTKAYSNKPFWTGGYVGLNAGYSFGVSGSAANSGWSNPNISPYSLDVFLFGAPQVIAARTLANSGSGRGISQNGFIGGGQAGYNFEFGHSLIAGFETDIQGAGIRGTGNANGGASAGNSTAFITNNVVQAGVDWLGTARGRIGYRVVPEVMVYATGGLSYGGVFLNTSPVSSIISSTNSENDPTQWTNKSSQKILVGWVAGAGGEWMLSKNWSVKSEALYYDIDSLSVTNSQFFAGSDNIVHGYSSIVGGSTTTAYYTGIMARLGVNYHFSSTNVWTNTSKF